MKVHEISLKEARALTLRAHRLSGLDFGSGAAGAHAAIEHLGYVQIDTISVVERAHHHVLWSRVSDYQPRQLDQLIDGKKIFEYWSHAAAFLPMRDFRYSLPRKSRYRTRRKEFYRNKKILGEVLERIREEGPLPSRAFEHVRKRSGWWDWKPAKRALEALYNDGTLMVAKREAFQKIYDLTERVLPSDVDTTLPTDAELARHLIESTIRAQGFASFQEIGYLRDPITKAHVKSELQSLSEGGAIVPLRIEKEEQLFFTDEKHLAGLNSPDKTRTILLSPFDNLIIQRKRLKQRFNFDYQIECYTPEPKRTFGYFSLPLLHEGLFIGRADCKAERKKGVLTLNTLHLEGRTGCVPRIADAIREFAGFNGCTSIVLSPKVPRSVRRALQSELRKAGAT